MTKRKIIKIDTEICTGCGQCLPNCPEGALQIIDGKAHLVSDLFCDGLGACLGYCPEGAITIEERDAGQYDERKVMENILRQGKNVVAAHLKHLEGHNQKEYLKQAQDFLKEKGIGPIPVTEEGEGTPKELPCGCPGTKVMQFENKGADTYYIGKQGQQSCLSNWPVQLMLVPPFAPYLNNADLLIAADCVPFAYAGFHDDLLKGKVLLVGCPKLDNLKAHQEKIMQILKNNNIKSITYAHMEVPCCFGLATVIEQAVSDSGKDTPFEKVVISIKGGRLK